MKHDMANLFIMVFALLLPLPATAEDEALAKLFARHGVDGTIVIAPLHRGQAFIHNDSRASRRISPASTFKILNTLIAVEEKAIAGKDSLLKWDGHQYEIQDWNHDQTLESAFKVSCVWCFQQLARQVGAENYRKYLRGSAYGILHEPFDETTFWLDGSLQISAIGQVEFLKKLYQRKLRFSAPSYETLRQIMLAERTPDFAIWAKTGWAARVQPQVGWYVGYVETPKAAWFFALNMDILDAADLPLRQKLTREALRLKGVIP